MPGRGALSASERPVTAHQDEPGRPVLLNHTPGPWGFWRPWSRVSPSTGRAFQTGLLLPGSQGSGWLQGPPIAWVWLFQVEEGLEPSSGLKGLRPNAAEASGVNPVAMVTRSRPGAGPSHFTDGAAEWQEVRGLAQGQVASKQQGQGSSAGQPRLSGGSGSLGQLPWAGLLPAAPAPSQTPRGSQTRPRWKRFARRSTRPWRRTANTSTPSSQEGEPRPSLCLDGPRGLFADPLPGAGPPHQPFRHSCELEGDTLPSSRAVGD